MTHSEAQQLVSRRNMLAAELPAAMQFKAELTGAAEQILRGTQALVAVGGSRTTVHESRDGSVRSETVALSPKAALVALRMTASELSRQAYAYSSPADDADIRDCATTLQANLVAFVAVVPVMNTAFYIGGIQRGCANVLGMLPEAPKARVR